MKEPFNEWGDPKGLNLDLEPDETVTPVITITVKPPIGQILYGWFLLLGWPLIWVLIAHFLFHW